MVFGIDSPEINVWVKCLICVNQNNNNNNMQKLLLFLLLACIAAAPAAAQSSEPFLTLNTEMHSAKLSRISTDKQNRYALTSSDDKTAKLWRLSDGQLLQTFRIPMGNGDEGKLYACALSPDGLTAAIGGCTGWEWDNQFSIYLFNTQSGEMIQRIGGHPSVISDLEYSPDGRYLVAALLGSNGIRIYRSSDYQLAAEDKEYGDISYNVAFDANGRLATVSLDGKLRLYDAQLKLQKKMVTSGGKQPYSLAFSPDGKLLAVGYYDSPTVQVLDGQSLEFLYSPNTTGVTKGIPVLTFSIDGTQLVAGGGYHISSKYPIRVWAQGGRGSYQDYGVAENVIADIKPLLNGQFLFAGSFPDWGMLKPTDGRLTMYKAAEVYSLRAKDDTHFRLSPNAQAVGFTPSGKSPLQFFLANRQISQMASSEASYSDSRKDIQISDWQNNEKPKLNGKEISVLRQYEKCRSVDIDKAAKGFVLGATSGIYGLNADGTKRWETPVPATPWCIKIAESAQVVAAGLGDGTIRWYSMKDGKLLLSLFLHPDGRWILWTPSGYYDAAAGAEELIGWHLNQGKDKAALYYPVAKFRSTYYRPDIIDELINVWDEATAIRQANEKANRSNTRSVTIESELPPTVRIVSPTDGTSVSSTRVVISYSISSPNDEPISEVRYLIDGRPLATKRGLKPLSQQRDTLTIPAADCKLSVLAQNRFGSSEAATVALHWSGAAIKVDLRPKLYILAVGIGAYQNVKTLDFAAKDARDFVGVMKQQTELYADIQVQLLTDGDATKDNILDGLDWLQRQTTHRDVAMLFLAGHGIDDNSSTFYYLPVNADLTALRRTGLMQAEIQQTVASVAGKVVVFMDACHSGTLMKDINRRDLPPDINTIVNELISAENGAVVFSSSTGRQYSLEKKEWNNGVFTKALVEGLSGGAVSNESGRISVKSLDAYIAERVKSLTGGEQTPTTNYPPNVPDFPIGIKK